MDTALARVIAEKIVKKRKLEAELKALKRDIHDLEGPLIDVMVAEGVPRFTINLDLVAVTLTPKSIERCGVNHDSTKEQVAGALIANGFDALVKQDFNLNALSALLREAREDGGDLPVGIISLLDVRTDVSILATIS